MKPPYILTFNWHESYIHLLAKTGYEFDVVEKWKGGRYGWVKEFRPVPPNCRLISEDEAREGLKSGSYDRIIAHNINDLLFVKECLTPKVLIFHNKLSTEIALGGKGVDKNEYLGRLRQLFDTIKNLSLVFISGAKRDDWGLDGEIILPGIDPSEYNGYAGDVEKVLRVGNLLIERDIMLGYSLQERILSSLPSTVLGLNPNITVSQLPKDWEEFKDFLKNHRVYLNSTLEPYEDGYNLAMLEAMTTGMPVVSIANLSSPIEDGINGFVSADNGYLRNRIEELLKYLSLAETLGQRARETVMDRFPMERFIRDWKRVIGDSGFLSFPEQTTVTESKKLKILMSYTSNPQTTAAYIEKALRNSHDVITFGPSIDDKILKEWDMESIKNRVREHDIPYFTADLREVLQRLPQEWVPDLFLWVETGISYPMEAIESLPCTSACYLIDTHLNLDRHIAIARAFDYVFLAQRAYIPRFRDVGIGRVFWLPLACDPEIHGRKTEKKLYDIGFVGSLTDPKRVDMLNKLGSRFTLHYERCFLEKMTEVFSRSKIVFNNSIKDDLNMRVFEAMASGSLLLTDEAKGSGLTEFFQDRKHLVIYRDEKELLRLAEYYLENDDERERIVSEGMEEVLNRHTYKHRISEMLSMIFSLPSMDAKDRGYFSQERKDVEALIPEDTMRILEVGCGEGILGKRLLEKGAKEVIGIEINPEICRRAVRNLSGIICGDIEELELPFDPQFFNCIIFADVLEHLRDPQLALKKLKNYLSPSGTVVASIPNVGYYGVIDMVVEGRWKYEDCGILDKTHLRFFTKKEIESLFNEAGLEIIGITENIDPAYYNLNDPLSGEISFGRVSLKGLLPEELKDLFVVQYLIKAQKTGHEIQKVHDTVKSAVEAGNLEGANRALEEYLESHPSDTDILYGHADVCCKLGLSDKAMESLERLLIFEPERKDALELRRKITEEVNANKYL